MTPIQISVAILMVGVTIAIFVRFREILAAGSAGRMMGMMKRVGLDPGDAVFGDAQFRAVLKKARHRCRRCPREGLCERWLEGAVEGSNAFCPNATVFRMLTDTGAHIG